MQETVTELSTAVSSDKKHTGGSRLMWGGPNPEPPPPTELQPIGVGWSSAGKLALLALICFLLTPGSIAYKAGSSTAVLSVSIFCATVPTLLWRWLSLNGRNASWSRVLGVATTTTLFIGVGWILVSVLLGLAFNFHRPSSQPPGLMSSAPRGGKPSSQAVQRSCSRYFPIERDCSPSETASMNFLDACMAEMKSVYADIWEVQAKDLSRQYCYCREKFARPYFEDSDVRKAYLLGDRRVVAGIARSEATCKQEAVKDGRRFAPDDPQPGWP